MEKYLAIAVLFFVGALITPALLESQLDKSDLQVEHNAVTPQADSRISTIRKTSHNPLEGRKAHIKMDQRGHFVVEARMNGRKSRVLVDTGATYVAINESTARKLGIRLKDSDFKYKVHTANGVTMAAAAMIKEIEIGRVRVKDVQASVSRDKALSTILLGMSFLKKLKKFEISDDELVLTQ